MKVIIHIGWIFSYIRSCQTNCKMPSQPYNLVTHLQTTKNVRRCKVGGGSRLQIPNYRLAVNKSYVPLWLFSPIDRTHCATVWICQSLIWVYKCCHHCTSDCIVLKKWVTFLKIWFTALLQSLLCCVEMHYNWIIGIQFLNTLELLFNLSFEIEWCLITHSSVMV